MGAGVATAPATASSRSPTSGSSIGEVVRLAEGALIDEDAPEISEMEVGWRHAWFGEAVLYTSDLAEAAWYGLLRGCSRGVSSLLWRDGATDPAGTGMIICVGLSEALGAPEAKVPRDVGGMKCERVLGSAVRRESLLKTTYRLAGTRLPWCTRVAADGTRHKIRSRCLLVQVVGGVPCVPEES